MPGVSASLCQEGAEPASSTWPGGATGVIEGLSAFVSTSVNSVGNAHDADLGEASCLGPEDRQLLRPIRCHFIWFIVCFKFELVASI